MDFDSRVTTFFTMIPLVPPEKTWEGPRVAWVKNSRSAFPHVGDSVTGPIPFGYRWGFPVARFHSKLSVYLRKLA